MNCQFAISIRKPLGSISTISDAASTGWTAMLRLTMSTATSNSVGWKSIMHCMLLRAAYLALDAKLSTQLTEEGTGVEATLVATIEFVEKLGYLAHSCQFPLFGKCPDAIRIFCPLRGHLSVIVQAVGGAGIICIGDFVSISFFLKSIFYCERIKEKRIIYQTD